MSNAFVPNLRSAVLAWAKPTTIFIAAKKQRDFKTYETYYQYNLLLFRVPSSQNLEFKREGQRAWNEETIYTDTSLILNTDDIIYFESTESERFRIISKIDYKNFGYMQYEIKSDWG
jgi:hypothetical protein